MRYFLSFLFVITLVSIFLMPAWISWVPKASWPLPVKRVTVSTMVVISTVFTVIVIAKPNADLNTRIIGSVIAILYLLIVFVITYHSWPK